MTVSCRRFGRTELSMPVLTCGAMRFQESWQDLPPGKTSRKSDDNVVAIVEKAWENGIRHFETARGYGTSEYQLGRALKRHPRESLLLQTKIGPENDPAAFEAKLKTSFERLGADYLDLAAIHGIDLPEQLDPVLRKGGCLDVLEKWRARGAVRHIGFSTHAGPAMVKKVIETGRFAFVNLHYYYIRQENAAALEAAAAADMGTLIISPNDKGGHLYDPPETLRRLTAPLAPMAFNDLFCLRRPELHTLSIGVARPTDFDLHVKTVEALDRADALIAPILERLDRRVREVMGDAWPERWREGVPSYLDTPGNVNIESILWIYALDRCFDLRAFALDRYNLLGNGGHWFPGQKFDAAAAPDWRAIVKNSPFADRIPDMLREAHRLFLGAPHKPKSSD